MSDNYCGEEEALGPGILEAVAVALLLGAWVTAVGLHAYAKAFEISIVVIAIALQHDGAARVLEPSLQPRDLAASTAQASVPPLPPSAASPLRCWLRARPVPARAAVLATPRQARERRAGQIPRRGLQRRRAAERGVAEDSVLGLLQHRTSSSTSRTSRTASSWATWSRPKRATA